MGEASSLVKLGLPLYWVTPCTLSRGPAWVHKGGSSRGCLSPELTPHRRMTPDPQSTTTTYPPPPPTLTALWTYGLPTGLSHTSTPSSLPPPSVYFASAARALIARIHTFSWSQLSPSGVAASARTPPDPPGSPLCTTGKLYFRSPSISSCMHSGRVIMSARFAWLGTHSPYQSR